MHPAIRAFQDGDIKDVLSILCLKAFHKLTRPVVEKILKICGVKTDKNNTFFQLLFFLIQTHLKTDDRTTLDILAMRMTLTDAEEDFMEHVLALDEATDVLEEADIAVLNKEKQSAENGTATHEDFKLEYYLKAKAVREAVAAKGAGKGAKRCWERCCSRWRRWWSSRWPLPR